MESKTDRTLERIAKALESIAKDFHKVTAPARGVPREGGHVAPPPARSALLDNGYVGGEYIGVPISAPIAEPKPLPDGNFMGGHW